MNRIKQLLSNHELVRVFGVGRIPHPNFIQILGIREGFHGIWIDLEHTGMSIEHVESATLAARSVGLECFCRIAPTDYATVTRCMEAGAGGVMAAQIFSAKQAKEFLKWSKFYPLGSRGLNTGGYDALYGKLSVAEFCDKANQDSFIAIQIETSQALQECEAIAAIEGVDLLFVGPSDLSQALGVPGQFFHEKCITALEQIGMACRNAGKPWGAVCANPEHAQIMIDFGCRLLSPSNDVRLVAQGIEALKGTYEKLFSK